MQSCMYVHSGSVAVVTAVANYRFYRGELTVAIYKGDNTGESRGQTPRGKLTMPGHCKVCYLVGKLLQVSWYACRSIR